MSIPKLWEDVDRVADLFSQFIFYFVLVRTVGDKVDEVEVPDPGPNDNIFNNFFKQPKPITRQIPKE